VITGSTYSLISLQHLLPQKWLAGTLGVTEGFFPEHPWLLEQPMFNLRKARTAAVAACAMGAFVIAPANAVNSFNVIDTVPATGKFTLTTSPGILPAWTSAGIELNAITPASLTELSLTASERLEMPVVAKTGSANALAGGFKFTNTKTRQVVNCFIPTLDTKARVLDCVTIGAGAVWETNKVFFAISGIDSRGSVTESGMRTTTMTGVTFNIPDSATAKFFNDQLSTTVFTTSVTIATGTLEVTRRATS